MFRELNSRGRVLFPKPAEAITACRNPPELIERFTPPLCLPPIYSAVHCDSLAVDLGSFISGPIFTNVVANLLLREL